MISRFLKEIPARSWRNSFFRIEKRAVAVVMLSSMGEEVVVDAEEAPLKII